MSNIFIASGKEVKERAENKGLTPRKNVFIRLADGESVRIAFFPDQESLFKEYYCHTDFMRKIYSHPCILENCPSCQANIKRSRKVLIPVYDLDNKDVRIIDASITQFTTIARVMEEYKDEKIAFKYSRSGTGTNTVYTLTPILPNKLSNEDKQKMNELHEIQAKITDEFLLKALNPKTREQMIEMLENSGVGNNDDDDVEPLNEDELPF